MTGRMRAEHRCLVARSLTGYIEAETQRRRQMFLIDRSATRRRARDHSRPETR
jgi:hypothetical protein